MSQILGFGVRYYEVDFFIVFILSSEASVLITFADYWWESWFFLSLSFYWASCFFNIASFSFYSFYSLILSTYAFIASAFSSNTRNWFVKIYSYCSYCLSEASNLSSFWSMCEENKDSAVYLLNFYYMNSKSSSTSGTVAWYDLDISRNSI